MKNSRYFTQLLLAFMYFYATPSVDSGILKGLYFGCNKDNALSKELIHIVNRRVKQLAETGRLKPLFAKYKMDDAHFDDIRTQSN